MVKCTVFTFFQPLQKIIFEKLSANESYISGQFRAGMGNFLSTQGRIIKFPKDRGPHDNICGLCIRRNTNCALYTDFFHIYAVLMFISTAILKIRVTSLYDFRSLDHLFQ